MSLVDRWLKQLEQRCDEGRLRTLRSPAGLDFSSNDYLGYAKRNWPALPGSRSGTASRLLRGHLPIWDEVETALAAWHGAESALVMTSGYSANEGLLSTIIEPGDFAFSDEFNHASIIDGLRLSRADKVIFPHNDVDALEAQLRLRQRRRLPQEAWFIITESLFGMEGDVAPLQALAHLGGRFDAHLIVDEAHATGCFGSNGSGLVDLLGLRNRVLATVHTGGKALAATGAYLVGSRLLKDMLVNRCRHLIYTTALPPQMGTWWLDAIALASRDDATRQALRQRVESFRVELDARGLHASGANHVVPIVLGTDQAALAVATHLQHAGFDIRAIRSPTVPVGTARLRIALHADHEPHDLQRLVETLAAAMAER